MSPGMTHAAGQLDDDHRGGDGEDARLGTDPEHADHGQKLSQNSRTMGSMTSMGPVSGKLTECRVPGRRPGQLVL